MPTSETGCEAKVKCADTYGLTYQEIGDIPCNSGLTVRNAVAAIQKKPEFKARQQMVVWAVRIGLVHPYGP